jgi:hypothetical protein
MGYNREKAVSYARQWAHERNPAYCNFDDMGGDCTNFCSQCLYAGGGVMNYTQDTGWYYSSPDNRAAAWSGVEFLHKFLTGNEHTGPYAAELPLEQAQPGDIIQLSFDGSVFSHSLFVVGVEPEITVATHSQDSLDRPLRSYQYQLARLLRIEGVRT